MLEHCYHWDAETQSFLFGTRLVVSTWGWWLLEPRQHLQVRQLLGFWSTKFKASKTAGSVSMKPIAVAETIQAIANLNIICEVFWTQVGTRAVFCLCVAREFWSHNTECRATDQNLSWILPFWDLKPRVFWEKCKTHNEQYYQSPVIVCFTFSFESLRFCVSAEQNLWLLNWIWLNCQSVEQPAILHAHAPTPHLFPTAFRTPFAAQAQTDGCQR